MNQMTWAVSCLAVALLGLGAVSASGADRATIYLGHEEDLESFRVEVLIDGKSIGEMKGVVSQLRAEPAISFKLPPGLHHYEVRGEFGYAGGRKIPLSGSGAVASKEVLEKRLLAAGSQKAPLDAFAALLQEVSKVAGASLSRPRLERGQPISAESMAAAEKRLGFPLPESYRRIASTYGSFTLYGRDDEGKEVPTAALYPPEKVFVVPEWRSKVLGVPLGKGDSPRAEANVAKLAGDFVFGHTNDVAWVARAGTHPRCPNGQPSFSAELLFEMGEGEDIWNEDTDAYSSYFGMREAQCEERSAFLQESFVAIFLGELGESKRLGLANHEGRLRLLRDEEASTPSKIILWME